jgi:CRISPR-associated protein Cas2
MYDIGDDKKRTKVEKILSGYGIRVNYSVFECIVTKKQFRQMLEKLRSVTNKEDHIRIYVLDKEVLKRSFVLHSSQRVFEYEEPYF